MKLEKNDFNNINLVFDDYEDVDGSYTFDEYKITNVENFNDTISIYFEVLTDIENDYKYTALFIGYISIDLSKIIEFLNTNKYKLELSRLNLTDIIVKNGLENSDFNPKDYKFEIENFVNEYITFYLEK